MEPVCTRLYYFAENLTVQSFRMLVDFTGDQNSDPKDLVVQLMKELNLIGSDQYQCGKTKIFLKVSHALPNHHDAELPLGWTIGST